MVPMGIKYYSYLLDFKISIQTRTLYAWKRRFNHVFQNLQFVEFIRNIQIIFSTFFLFLL